MNVVGFLPEARNREQNRHGQSADSRPAFHGVDSNAQTVNVSPSLPDSTYTSTKHGGRYDAGLAIAGRHYSAGRLADISPGN